MSSRLSSRTLSAGLRTRSTSAGQRSRLTSACLRTRNARRSKHLTAKPTDGKSGTQHDAHDIELLEYEWPDLPPIPNIKTAITRQRVSRGIGYLLPVDKGHNSINNTYRTDLRAMFQEPYASAGVEYDDSRETLSSKIHLKSNTNDNTWTRRHVDTIVITLNSDSERSRTLYTRSAPSGEAAQRMGIDTSKLRTRSSLFLPIKSKLPPEAIRMRKEAEKLIKSVQEDNGEDFEEEIHKEAIEEETEGDKGSRNDSSVLDETTKHSSAELERRRSQRRETIRSTSSSPVKTQTLQAFQSYDDFKVAKVPKLIIPVSLRSPFLSDEQNQHIWEWLHCGEEISEFQHFLAMCG